MEGVCNKQVERWHISHNKIILAWWVLLLSAFAFLYYHSINRNISITETRLMIESFGVWGPVLFIVLYQMRVVMFFPISLLSTLAGSIWGLFGIVYVLTAICICATAEFFIARHYGRAKIEKFIKGRIRKVDAFIGNNAFASVFLIRLVPNVVFDVQNVALALTKVKFRDYIAGTVLGMLPGTLVLVYLGDSIINVLLNQEQGWGVILTLIALWCFILWGVFLKLRKRLMKDS